MSVREDIKTLLLKENMTLVALSKKLSAHRGDVVTADSISQRLRKGTMQYEDAMEIINLLGYKVKFEKL